jgi:twitching motility protein PilT
MSELLQLLKIARSHQASDLHLVVGTPPFMRIFGEIVLMSTPPLSPENIETIVREVITPSEIELFRQTKELSLSRALPEVGYLRITLYFHRLNIEAAIRLGSREVKTFQELGLPQALVELCRRTSGLILITGATGAGKTTTFNSIIDFINRERRCKIVTIEDPVEYIHLPQKSIIVQQEAYSDARSFSSALVHILRQDTDIIGVGEMRDIETISTCLTASETGHLVIGTIHTIDAVSTVDRIVDVFPPHQQDQIRFQFSSVLLAILSQKLLPRADKKGRVMACELLVANGAVRNIINTKKNIQLDNVISTGAREHMQSFDDAIRDFYLRGIITYDVALSVVKNPRVFDRYKGGTPDDHNQPNQKPAKETYPRP